LKRNQPYPADFGRGILGKHWEGLRLTHRDFYVEHPISKTMKRFLLKHAKGSEFYSIFQGEKRPATSLGELLAEEITKQGGGVKS
jgi:hypothetical protein